MRKTLFALTTMVATMIPGGTALAASDPTAAQYHDPAANAVQVGGGGLPYTGIDLLVLSLAAAMLVALGVVLLGVSRSHQH